MASYTAWQDIRSNNADGMKGVQVRFRYEVVKKDDKTNLAGGVWYGFKIEPQVRYTIDTKSSGAKAAIVMLADSIFHACNCNRSQKALKTVNGENAIFYGTSGNINKYVYPEGGTYNPWPGEYANSYISSQWVDDNWSIIDLWPVSEENTFGTTYKVRFYFCGNCAVANWNSTAGRGQLADKIWAYMYNNGGLDSFLYTVDVTVPTLRGRITKAITPSMEPDYANHVNTGTDCAFNSVKMKWTPPIAGTSNPIKSQSVLVSVYGKFDNTMKWNSKIYATSLGANVKEYTITKEKLTSLYGKAPRQNKNKALANGEWECFSVAIRGITDFEQKDSAYTAAQYYWNAQPSTPTDLKLYDGTTWTNASDNNIVDMSKYSSFRMAAATVNDLWLPYLESSKPDNMGLYSMKFSTQSVIDDSAYDTNYLYTNEEWRGRYIADDFPLASAPVGKGPVYAHFKGWDGQLFSADAATVQVYFGKQLTLEKNWSISGLENSSIITKNSNFVVPATCLDNTKYFSGTKETIDFYCKTNGDYVKFHSVTRDVLAKGQTSAYKASDLIPKLINALGISMFDDNGLEQLNLQFAIDITPTGEDRLKCRFENSANYILPLMTVRSYELVAADRNEQLYYQLGQAIPYIENSVTTAVTVSNVVWFSTIAYDIDYALLGDGVTEPKETDWINYSSFAFGEGITGSLQEILLNKLTYPNSAIRLRIRFFQKTEDNIITTVFYPTWHNGEKGIKRYFSSNFIVIDDTKEIDIVPQESDSKNSITWQGHVEHDLTDGARYFAVNLAHGYNENGSIFNNESSGIFKYYYSADLGQEPQYKVVICFDDVDIDGNFVVSSVKLDDKELAQMPDQTFYAANRQDEPMNLIFEIYEVLLTKPKWAIGDYEESKSRLEDNVSPLVHTVYINSTCPAQYESLNMSTATIMRKDGGVS